MPRTTDASIMADRAVCPVYPCRAAEYSFVWKMKYGVGISGYPNIRCRVPGRRPNIRSLQKCGNEGEGISAASRPSIPHCATPSAETGASIGTGRQPNAAILADCCVVAKVREPGCVPLQILVGSASTICRRVRPYAGATSRRFTGYGGWRGSEAGQAPMRSSRRRRVITAICPSASLISSSRVRARRRSSAAMIVSIEFIRATMMKGKPKRSA